MHPILAMPPSAWAYSTLSLMLAGIFSASGIAKIVRPRAASEAITNFLHLRSMPPLAGFMLGALELLAGLGAAGLLEGDYRRYVSIILLLCALFSGLIAVALRAGQTFACGCFGSSDAPLRPRTLVRALVLGVVAAAILIGAGPESAGPLHLRSALAAALIALWGLGTAAMDLKGLNDGFLQHLRLERAMEKAD